MDGDSKSGAWVKWAFGVAGAVIGFGISNWDAILNIFLGTTLTISTAQDLGSLGPGFRVAVHGMTSGTTSVDGSLSLEQSSKGIDVSPGLYEVSLIEGEAKLLSKLEEVHRGRHVLVTFTKQDFQSQWQQDQKIQVRVEIDNTKYAPGEPVHLRIATTGLGYLWIQEINDKGEVTASYPPTGQEGKNLISPTKFATFPDQDHESFTAEKDQGMYRLICLVTSSASRTDADKIFSDLRGFTTKGFGAVADNWGYGQATYTVAPVSAP